MLVLVRLELYTCLGSYNVYLCVQWVNDKYCVGVVPIPYLSAIVPYMPDHGVVHGGDSSIDSYIVPTVPLPCIGQGEQHFYKGVLLCLSSSLIISLCMDVVLSRNDCQV